VLRNKTSINQLKVYLETTNNHQGFALPTALALGLVMITLAGTSILAGQGIRNDAVQRRDTGESLLVAEGGVARTLAQIILPNNSVLLGRSYDPINPMTGKTYLGPDGIVSSGDESTASIDEWQSYVPNPASCADPASAAPSISYSGTLGNGTYKLKAYRYQPAEQTGTLLIEGIKESYKSSIAVTLSLSLDDSQFPGIIATETAYLQGRTFLGKNANVYFNPDAYHAGHAGLAGSAASGDSTRPSFLNATWAGTTDGFDSDVIEGEIIACTFTLTVPDTPPPGAINLGNIETSRTIVASGSDVTSYIINQLDLSGNSVLKVDTTAGPVSLYIAERLYLRGSAGIVNVRTDGQPPRVGDLRLFGIGGSGYEFGLFDTACIQGAFIHNKESDLQLQTSGPPTPLPTGECAMGANVEGVVWVEDFISSRTNATTRMDPDSNEGDGDIDSTPGVTAGIIVPDDVSSLSDVLSNVGITPRYRFEQIKHWQRVN
jgi:hypothetical protein